MTRANTQMRNPETTRAGILEAAEASFTARGFAGTSMRDIAGAANVHQSLIHHYFGTKQALWRAVVERYVEAYLDRQLPHLEDDKLDAATLPRALEIEFKFWRDNPNLLRLQNWALLEGGNPFGEKRDALYAPFIPIMQALQKAGFIRADIEPFHALVMAAASVGFWLQNRDEIAVALHHDLAAAKAADDRFFADMMKILFDGGIATMRE